MKGGTRSSYLTAGRRDHQGVGHQQRRFGLLDERHGRHGDGDLVKHGHVRDGEPEH